MREAVLELAYTSNDMSDFAIAMGPVEVNGAAKPAYVWDEECRLHVKAKLDALYFHLYGVTDKDDVTYVYSTFGVFERAERAL